MSILAAQSKVYKSQVNDDTSSNGGRRSANEVVSGSSAGLFPFVSVAEASTGITRFRKGIRHIENSEDLSSINTLDWLQKPTPGDDMIFLLAGTHDNIQGSLTGSEDLYGASYLDATISAGATSFDVRVEDGTVILFRNGEKLYLSDKVNESDVAGNAEFATISGTPTIVGDIVTITVTAPIVNGYSAVSDATHVSSILDSEVVETSVSGVTPTTVSGTFDDSQMTVHNVGGTYENVTITLTDGASFTAVGDTLGSLGGGNLSADFAPVNPNTGTPYFTIPAAAWGGTWVAAETVVLTTNPIDVPTFEKQVVPAGAASISGNTRRRIMYGEST